MTAILLSISGGYDLFCIENGGNASCKSCANAPNEKIIMSLNEVQEVWEEKKRRQIGGMYYSNPSFSG